MIRLLSVTIYLERADGILSHADKNMLLITTWSYISIQKLQIYNKCRWNIRMLIELFCHVLRHIGTKALLIPCRRIPFESIFGKIIIALTLFFLFSDKSNAIFSQHFPLTSLRSLLIYMCLIMMVCLFKCEFKRIGEIFTDYLSGAVPQEITLYFIFTLCYLYIFADLIPPLYKQYISCVVIDYK